jgi:TPR repeat protein
MYQKGDELPLDQNQMMRWLQRAAQQSSQAKVMMASILLKQPDGPSHYAEVMDLCKAAAADYAPGLHCVGSMYRHGLGVNKDLVEAVKWYRKAEGRDLPSTLELAEMYAYGEGTKADRVEAFMLFFEAGQMGSKDAAQNCVALWDRMDQSELKTTGKRLRQRNFDPEKTIDALRKVSATGTR